MQITRTAGASCGWRTNARRRISPRSTSADPRTRRWSCKPTAAPSCAPIRWNCRRHHGRRVPDAEVGQKPAGFDLFDICVPEKPRRSRFSIARARIRSAFTACGSGRRVRPYRSGAPDFEPRIRSTTSSTAASTCAIPRSRSRSAAGGCPAPARATTSRRRRGIRSTAAIVRTTPTYIRSARIGSTSAISTAAVRHGHQR